MMRLKRGDTVEVMNKKDVPASWRVAEILSVNGPTYSVRYDCCSGIAGEHMETVSRSSVRPCPPLVQGVENFNVGDIVEVFYENSWKIAALLKVLESKKCQKVPPQDTAVQKQYFVRLIGCSRSWELIVLGSNIRMRQFWKEGKWFLIGKGSREGGDVASKPSTSNFYQNMSFKLREFNGKTTKHPTLKRKSPYVSSVIEASKGRVQKLRAIKKDGSKKRVSAAPMLQKVDAVSYPKEVLGKKDMHASFKTVSTGYNQMERTKLSDVLCYSVVRISENESESATCSVGSCSITDQPTCNFYNPCIPQPWPQENALSSDAESCNGSDSERKCSSFFSKEEVEVSIHRLELHAYCRTLEALYASGPLSWEQEALLTNLRIMLNISNDEHLMEVKHLICAENAIDSR